jgi:hypothetical protein
VFVFWGAVRRASPPGDRVRPHVGAPLPSAEDCFRRATRRFAIYTISLFASAAHGRHRLRSGFAAAGPAIAGSPSVAPALSGSAASSSVFALARHARPRIFSGHDSIAQKGARI